jgi:hypothetical protein
MKVPIVILALLVLVAIIGFIVPMSIRTDTSKEPFAPRADYIQTGQQRYNQFADNIDVTRPNFAVAESASDIAAATRSLYDIMNTADIVPKLNGSTFTEVSRDVVTAKVPKTTQIMRDLKHCESLTGRTCEALGSSENAKCGVCLKGGTTYDGKNPGQHTGGLFIMPEDKQYQIKLGQDTGKPTTYKPTVGTCPEGYFFADIDSCKKARNRLDCKESGETGGFTGKTVDGRSVANQICAQAFVGDNVFLYDPKDRTFNLNLRVLTPQGSGQARVYVYDTNNQQLGYGVSNTAGREFLVPINGVRELQSLRVIVALEVPHRRPDGKKEVFNYSVNEGGTNNPGYNQSRESSIEICKRIGARSATEVELLASANNGAQLCGAAHTRDSSIAMWPMQSSLPGCGNRGLAKWDVPYGTSWCYGVKPPNSTNQTLFFTKVAPFFNTLGGIGESPSQASRANIWSQHGDTYQAPFARGVLMQWEMPIRGKSPRTAGFGSSIIAVNQVPSDPDTGNNRVLRQLGTYKGSKIIAAPKPDSGSSMITNQFWLWSNLASDQYVRFDVKVPGVFLDPFYPEDKGKAPSGVLITSPDTAALLRTSPCLVDGQVPGAYSIACLTNLFVSSGGDPTTGKLATTGGGLSQLNSKGDMDDISSYLDNLYNLATKGRDNNGNKGNMASINNAAQALFGFDLMTPCENIAEDAKGNILLVPKSGGLDSECLDYLWMNTGTDRSRGNEIKRKSTIYNTYVSIGDRFSGLLSSEGAPATRKEYPFQTCQRAGSYAPVRANGTPNSTSISDVNAAASAARTKACAAGGDPRCSTGSLVGFVQDIYNGIFQTANAGTGDAGSTNQESAITKCYGLAKAPSPPPSYITLESGMIVGNVDMPVGNYTLEMDITPRGIVSNWGSIIHVTNDAANGNCCAPGQRAPGIWFTPDSTSLHIRIGDASDGNWGIDATSALPMNQTTRLRIEASGRTVTVTCGANTYNLTQPTRRPTGNFAIYMADPWYAVANADIANVKYIVDGVDIKIAQPSRVKLALGKVVGKVNIPVGNYTMDMDITPRGLVGNWGSIIHVTGDGNNCCAFGQRAPGIWFLPNATSLHVRLGDSADGNWGIDATSPLPMNKTTHFRIVANGRTVTVTCGANTYNLTQPTRRPTGNNYTIFMSDPWHAVPNAEITNFKYIVDGVEVKIAA